MTTVTVTEFKNSVSRFIDGSQKEPVYITKHGKRVVAMIGAMELERLITAADNRQTYFTKDLPLEAIEAFMEGPKAPSRPELNHLMKDRIL